MKAPVSVLAVVFAAGLGAAHARPRPPWTGSRLVGTPEPLPPFKVEPAFPHLRFTKPVELVAAPGSNRLFLAEQGGKIFSFPNRRDVEKAEVFASLADARPGLTNLYGMAFHPQFRRNRAVFVVYTVEDGTPDGTHLSRFLATSDDPPRLDPKSETVFLEWQSGGHNGGSIKFGLDGYLYISTGDAGAPFPPDKMNVGQALGDLLSAVLRIDVDHPAGGRPYGVPSDNPFISRKGARPEIWAYGLRNPWRMSIDPGTGALWLGDVGWETWELVHRIQRGGNYGWSVMEGPQRVRADASAGPTPILPPVAAHPHSEARSITGGHVYRGRDVPGLEGAYIYGDFETGKIWGLRHDGKTGRVTWQQELADSRLKVVAFGVDSAGELVVVDYGGGASEASRGSLFRLAPNPAAKANVDFPRQLSRTGLFRSVRNHALAPGVVEYAINAEPWADGATARRFIALPGRSQVIVGRRAWEYPAGAVLGKTLSLPGGPPGTTKTAHRVETQISHFDGNEWRRYSYRWNEEQTDAVLVGAAGDEVPVALVEGAAPGVPAQRLTWRIPGRAECGTCHNAFAGSVMGFVTDQLARAVQGREQLAALAAARVLSEAPPAPAREARLVNPYDPAADANARSRSYLHVNCAHCHRRDAGGMTPIMLSRDVDLTGTNLVNGQPTQGTFGMAGAAVVAPGNPFRSVLLYRLATVGGGRMPRLGSRVVDERALALFETWIRELPPGAAGDAEEALDASTIDRLLGTTGGALRLARALGAGRVAHALRAEAIARGINHEHPEIRGLFEAFVPEEQRVVRLGEHVDPRAVLALAGHPERGRRMFFGSAVACLTCHVVEKKGGALGPDLSHIGSRYSREQILEAVIEPSKAIDAAYLWYVLETTDGQTLAGILKERTKRAVVLMDASNVPVRVPAANLKRLVAQEQSAMPQMLLAALTAQEAADLIAFLASLK